VVETLRIYSTILSTVALYSLFVTIVHVPPTNL
jgi:hypothetical protein